MPNINLNYKMVTDIKNNFFTNNRFIAAESLPAEGDFVKGDLIVNIGENANDEAMWLCVESGNPGVWEVVGAGAGGGSSKIVTLKSRVAVNNALSEVNIGVSGFNKATDTLLVFNNARFMVEGVDYEINADSTKIVAMNGNIWNEELANDFVFDFVVFKMMNVNENGDVVVSSANEIVKLKNTVIVNEAVNEVEIGIDGFNEGDDLTVYKNSVYMMEGIDYEVNADSNKIILNEACAVGSIFAFEVIKTVAKINPDAVVGMEHLNEDVRGAIEAAGNIDLSGYQGKNDEGLVTTDKTIVGAINELFQDVDSGKTIIADAIDDRNINKDSTFAAMGEAIEGIHADREEDRQKLIEILQGSNMDLTGNESMDTLLDLIDMSNLDLSKIVQVACGNNHTFILYNDGRLYGSGSNTSGELGLGDTTNRNVFTQVTTNINNDVKQIACGGSQTFIIKNDGSLWATGSNYIGQLGLVENANITTFTQVTTNINNDVKQVACGHQHTFILKNDGSLWACGYNLYGQLGLGNSGDNANINTFTQVTTNINNDVKQVVCGSQFTFIIKNDGTLWSCGRNNYGQLGLGNTSQKTTFTKATTNVSNVKQVACGNDFTFILKNDGSVWGCGYNEYGQLGIEVSGPSHTTKSQFTKSININNDAKQISCGTYHAMVVKNDGSLWCTGYNNTYQLGILTYSQRSTFTQVTENISNDVKEVICGYSHTMVIKEDDTIWACGYNISGQLGIGYNENKQTFTAVNQSEALKTQLTSLQLEITTNRGNLATVLTDEGVELTGDETLADLIVKTDEEFDRKNANAGGGLDIISATTLPATGKENQICVITDNPVNDFVITSNYSDINTNNTIYIFLGNSLDTTGIKGTNFDLVSNNITMKYYLLSVHQGGNKLDSYIFKNNQWTNATMSSFYIVEKGTSVNESYTGGFTGEWVVGDLNGTPCYTVNIPNNVSAGGGTMCFDNCTVNKINVSDYTTLEYTIASSMPDYSFAGEVYMLLSTTRNITMYIEEIYKYWKTSQPGNLTTYTINISDITGEFYLGIAYIGRGYGQKLCVSDIRLY